VSAARGAGTVRGLLRGGRRAGGAARARAVAARCMMLMAHRDPLAMDSEYTRSNVRTDRATSRRDV
jgi:hypothetical protein